MNASAVIAFLVSVLLVAVSGIPAVNNFKSGGLLSQEREEARESELLPLENFDDQEEKIRIRRVTCDLLSVSVPFGSLNHSACAAHCLSKRKGYKGGRCKDGVCHCRK